MEVDSTAPPAPRSSSDTAPVVATAVSTMKVPKPSAASAPEVEAYLCLVALDMLQEAGAWVALAEGCTVLRRLMAASGGVGGVASGGRRSLDFFAARLLSLEVLAAERAGGAGSVDALQPALLSAHRTAVLRHDDYGSAVALNLALRGCLRASAFDAAGKLLSKALFPEGVSSAQLARYLFYKGRVQAIALDYSDALASFNAAARKAPPSALGFIAAATKFSVIAQLLTGDLPDRATFVPAHASVRTALAPYFELTSSVRHGDLAAFSRALSVHSSVFQRDGTLTLVQRVEANVIKTGLRSLCLAYSRISFKDVAAKLGLGSAEDAEFLCAKVRCVCGLLWSY